MEEIKFTQLPLLDVDSKTKEELKKKYMQMGLKAYNSAKKLTLAEYNKLKQDLDNNVIDINELLEKSIYHIIEALAAIYAKYEIENVLPFDEGLSACILKINKGLVNFKKLPKFLSQYCISVINFYVYNVVSLNYNQELENTKVELMSNQSLFWLIDSMGGEDFSFKSLNLQDIDKKLKSLLSLLNERQARILSLRFGLITGEQMTYDEIAKRENISRMRAKNITTQALDNLRKMHKIKQLNGYCNSDLNL